MNENQLIEEHGDVQVFRTKDGFRLFCEGKECFARGYDEITFDPVEQIFLCRWQRNYDIFSLQGKKSCNSWRTSYGDDRETDGCCDFYCEGKFGCRVHGVVILPPVYDDVDKWADCDVIYTRKGMDVRYFDLQGNEILKNRREIPDGKDYMEPYYSDEPQHTNVVQTMDCSERPEGEDFCVCYGYYAGLSRRTRKEHMDWIKRQSCVCKRFRDVTLFAWDCYIYSAYLFQSRPDARNPVADCLQQLEALDILWSGWHVILTILAPEHGFQHRITKTELKAIRRTQHRSVGIERWLPKYARAQDRTDCGRDDWTAIDAIYKGKTDRIGKGAIVLATLCFSDHCPTKDEMKKWEEAKARFERHKRKRRKRKPRYFGG